MTPQREEVAIVTGGDGDMGRTIVEACAEAGYHTILACRTVEEALPVLNAIVERLPNAVIEARAIELTSWESIVEFAESIGQEGKEVAILVNNAGVLCNNFTRTEGEIEESMAVNYVAPYLLTRLLLPYMKRGSRVVNTVSLTYRIGKIEKDFFYSSPKKSRFQRYANSKLALLLFSLELAERVKQRGISVNAADPGIVSTKMIRLDMWFDPLTDLLFRPLIKQPAKGASTAIALALSPTVEGQTAGCYVNKREKKLPNRVRNHPLRQRLWDETEALLCANPIIKSALKRATQLKRD